MDSARLVPLGQALAAHGLPRKAWDALVESGLIGAAEPVEGTHEYGLTESGAARLEQLMECRRALGGRFRVTALAFELARRGDRSVPAALLKAELVARMSRLFGLAKRSLEAHTGLTTRFGTAKSADILAAADRLAEPLSKHVPRENRAAAREAFRSGAFVLLNAVYLGADVRAQSRRAREVLHELAEFDATSPDTPVRQLLKALSTFADRLSDIRDIASLDQRRNPIFRQIEMIPDTAFSKLFETWPGVSGAVGRAWGRLARIVPLVELSPEQRETFDTLLLATVVLYCGSSSEAEAYAGLLRSLAATVDDSVDKVANWVEFGVAAHRLLPARIPA